MNIKLVLEYIYLKYVDSIRAEMRTIPAGFEALYPDDDGSSKSKVERKIDELDTRIKWITYTTVISLVVIISLSAISLGFSVSTNNTSFDSEFQEVCDKLDALLESFLIQANYTGGEIIADVNSEVFVSSIQTASYIGGLYNCHTNCTPSFS